MGLLPTQSWLSEPFLSKSVKHTEAKNLYKITKITS